MKCATANPRQIRSKQPRVSKTVPQGRQPAPAWQPAEHRRSQAYEAQETLFKAQAA